MFVNGVEVDASYLDLERHLADAEYILELYPQISTALKYDAKHTNLSMLALRRDIAEMKTKMRQMTGGVK